MYVQRQIMNMNKIIKVGSALLLLLILLLVIKSTLYQNIPQNTFQNTFKNTLQGTATPSAEQTLLAQLNANVRELTRENAQLRKEVDENRELIMNIVMEAVVKDGEGVSGQIRETYTLSHVTLDPIEKPPFGFVLDLLILVSTHARNEWRRKWIRSLWGNRTRWQTAKNWRLIFVAGHENDDEVMTSLREEALRHKDIMIESVVEDFHVMAKKVVIGLTWAKHHLKFHSLLKCDDDVFIHVENAVKFVNERRGKVGYYGNVNYGGKVDREGRYGVSEKEYQKDNYPPYCSGGGFFLTNESVHRLVPSFNINKVLRIDDAYIGEMAERAGVEASDSVGFYMTNTDCEYKDDMIVSHPAKEHRCMKHLTDRANNLIKMDKLYSSSLSKKMPVARDMAPVLNNEYIKNAMKSLLANKLEKNG